MQLWVEHLIELTGDIGQYLQAKVVLGYWIKVLEVERRCFFSLLASILIINSKVIIKICNNRAYKNKVLNELISMMI